MPNYPSKNLGVDLSQQPFAAHLRLAEELTAMYEQSNFFITLIHGVPEKVLFVRSSNPHQSNLMETS